MHVKVLWHFLHRSSSGRTDGRSRNGSVGKSLKHLRDRKEGNRVLPRETGVHPMSSDCSPQHC